MGPASTIKFLQLLIKKFHDETGAIRNIDFPRITLCTVPDSDHMAAIADSSLVKELASIFSVFRVARVEFVVAPCNTVHQFLAQANSDLADRLLSIVDAVLKSETEDLHSKRILLLSTRQTNSSHLYARVFEGLNSLPVILTSLDQEHLDAIINGANAGTNLAQLRNELLEIISKYDCDVVLLACTELSLLRPTSIGIPVVDSLQELANAAFLVSSRRRDINYYLYRA